MIAVVYPTEGSPPCVAMFTRRVKLHVGIRTWCDAEIDGSDGVFQMPDAMPVCKRCSAAITEYEKKLVK